ncbi:uncharacterized protein DUF4304 [Desulfobotulus alkaliphilus]|uniref:Uncharacterized protein DUF4304 n=2 Tax=Desulfobotulus alkaliphilus TaxID=622671 RepID=A0A562RS17_9BACT|nr:uncharacterized protein DUF4304 [Desulfobotulus alkaliphilus]
MGFEVDKAPTFYYRKDRVVGIFHIDFLNSQNAAYFNSNTASFSLNIGVFFNLQNIIIKPKEYESNIRGQILRDFRQKHPMKLKGFSWCHPERWRRDIWWVDKDGQNLEHILANACRLTKEKALKWFEKYSDPDHVIWLLKHGKENGKGGPFGFGSIGSPSRTDLIKKLETIKG